MSTTYSKYSLYLLLFVGLFVAQSCASNKPIRKSNRSISTKSKKRSKPVAETKPLANTREVKSRTKIIDTANKYIGTKYLYGGKDARGFDCSGLITKVFVENQIKVEGNSTGLSKKGKTKTIKNAEAGDLVFFKKGERVNHVALVTKVNDNELWVIHSTSSRGVIKENILASSYWRSKKYFFKDLL